MLSAAVTATMASADMACVDFESCPDGKIADGCDGWKIAHAKRGQKAVSSGAVDGNKSWLVAGKATSGSFSDRPYSPALSQKVGEAQAMSLFKASLLFKPLSGGGPSYSDSAGILFDNVPCPGSVAGEPAVPGPAAILPFGVGLLAAFRRRARR